MPRRVDPPPSASEERMRWFVALVIAGVGVVSPSVSDALMPWNMPIRNALSSESRLFVDLDGDGRRDSVSVKFYLGATAPECVVVRVGNHELTLEGDQIEAEVRSVDLDSADVRHELEFFEEGPSDDPAVTFVAMAGDSLFLLGELGGYSDEGRVTGDGFVSARTRGRVLQTWWYTQRYVLRTPTQLVPVEQSLYPMRTRVTLRDSLTLVRSPSDPRVAFKLRTGEHAELLATDDRRWVLLRDGSARIGWFGVDENGNVMEGHRDGQEVFDGLLIVD